MTLPRHHKHWPEGVPFTLEAPSRVLYDYVAEAAARTPEKTAVDYYGRSTSFQDFNRAVLNLAGYMQQHLGVARGDRVMLLMQNCPQSMSSSRAFPYHMSGQSSISTSSGSDTMPASVWRADSSNTSWFKSS